MKTVQISLYKLLEIIVLKNRYQLFPKTLGHMC